MSLSSQNKANIVAKYQRAAGDTGSPETQVALLSANIAELTGHFQKNPKDHHSRRGLLEMVNKRRKLLAYLKRVNNKRYQKLLEELDLRGG